MSKLEVASSFPPKGYEVKRITLHQAVDVPLGGGSVSAMYAKPGTGIGRSACTGVNMTFTDTGVFCQFKGQSFIVPLANIIAIYL